VAKVLVLALAALITAVLTRLLMPWLTKRLLRIAIERLPEAQRERFSEEWTSHINEVKGEISKVAVALGLISAGQPMASFLKSGEPSPLFRVRDDHQSEKRTSDVAEPVLQSIRLSIQGPIMSAQDFRRMITLVRKESERSRKPFMLLLLDIGDDLPSERDGRILANIEPALCASARDRDVTGWYSNNCVVGVMFTEIAIEESGSAPSTIITRVTQTLQGNLTLEQFNRVTLSFHVFPEDWDEESKQGPTNRTLYPDLSQREDGRKLSRTLKRMMDILGSSLAVAFFSPIFLIIAIAVKLTSDGPIFFRQRRVGQYGNPFVFLKFRSMYTNNEAEVHKQYVKRLIAGKADKHPSNGNGEGVYKLTKDSRITRVGAFLRKTSLDEFPQFINVLKGDMSLVGPRPPIPYEVEAYEEGDKLRLFSRKPGITGLWQVSGRSRVKFDDMVRLDLEYARNWSPWMDIKTPLRALGPFLILILVWAAVVLMILFSR
jgi:lipopolysaccharide/colanic/teichoic acid biosynthesis glycosyltransferase